MSNIWDVKFMVLELSLHLLLCFCKAGGNPENLEETHKDTGRTYERPSTQTATCTLDRTRNPAALRQQHYTLSGFRISCHNLQSEVQIQFLFDLLVFDYFLCMFLSCCLCVWGHISDEDEGEEVWQKGRHTDLRIDMNGVLFCLLWVSPLPCGGSFNPDFLCPALSRSEMLSFSSFLLCLTHITL